MADEDGALGSRLWPDPAPVIGVNQQMQNLAVFSAFQIHKYMCVYIHNALYSINTSGKSALVHSFTVTKVTIQFSKCL